mgnify:CR=1 FL=1
MRRRRETMPLGTKKSTYTKVALDEEAADVEAAAWSDDEQDGDVEPARKSARKAKTPRTAPAPSKKRGKSPAGAATTKRPRRSSRRTKASQ